MTHIIFSVYPSCDGSYNEYAVLYNGQPVARETDFRPAAKEALRRTLDQHGSRSFRLTVWNGWTGREREVTTRSK